MNIIRYIPALLSLIMAASCVDPFTPEVKDSNDPLVVIQGTIVSDSICPLWVSQTRTDLFADKPEYVGEIPSDTRLWVEGSDGTHYDGVLTGTDENRARFLVNVGHLNPDETYCVRLDINSDSYRSDPAFPEPTPEIESVNWEQLEADSAVAVSVTSAAPADGRNCYMVWKCLEDWEIMSNHTIYQYFSPEVNGSVRYDIDVNRGWKHAERLDPVIAAGNRFPENRITDQLLYDIPCRDDRISVIYSTHVIQRAISREEYEYIETEQKQTSGMGGIFTPMPGRLPTNIRCTTSPRKALGFVGVSLNVAHKRLYIEGREVTYVRAYPCDEDIVSSTSLAECYTLLEEGYQIYFWGGHGTGKWMPAVCLDVRNRDASLVRPDFWAY